MTTTATAPTPAHHLAPAAIPTPTTDTTTTNAGYPIPRGPVTSTLCFYAPPADGSKPFNYVEKPPAGQPEKNFGEHETAVSINDIRGRESAFNLDTNAFSVLQNVTSEERDFASDEHIKRVYYPEVERLLLENVEGAKRVLLFDHTIRRADPNAPRAPVVRVHIDQTRKSAEQRVHHHLPAEAASLLQSRYRIINVWRPLNGPVVSFPLAVADSATVEDGDLVGVEHRYPDRTGETAGVKFNEAQKWYYWSGMGNEERLLLKCFDSDETHGPRGRVPHTAFVDPRTPEGAPGRESIEVRALVFG
ncbi:hypothetical protein K490DRAFT_63354 [Saccharata proteae CBS 121410]|uniref:7alpha-cephem-methoxylase P8 chain related protein n=1 Tax=Saccharata proteae CBS 121410 TaxID=1314787 RepID=A0A6A5YCL2_9PEZI|nr:hypothetical protein K490DRAFT_63354 [Saccharata proteae CBS 121410]